MMEYPVFGAEICEYLRKNVDAINILTERVEAAEGELLLPAASTDKPFRLQYIRYGAHISELRPHLEKQVDIINELCGRLDKIEAKLDSMPKVSAENIEFALPVE